MRWRHKIIDTRQISQKRHEGTQHNHARGALRSRLTKASVVIIHSITRVTMIRNGQDCLTQVSYVRIIKPDSFKKAFFIFRKKCILVYTMVADRYTLSSSKLYQRMAYMAMIETRNEDII